MLQLNSSNVQITGHPYYYVTLRGLRGGGPWGGGGGAYQLVTETLLTGGWVGVIRFGQINVT